MKYTKPALTFDAQADMLLRRGLVADRAALIGKLRSVSYYRLSGYWHTFRDPAGDSFIAGTTLDAVWHRYVFDRQLRLMVMDAIERVEVAVRTQLVNRHTLKYGPFGYSAPSTLPGILPKEHAEFLVKVATEAERSREDFVTHFRGKYQEEAHLPLWMACELLTFGGTYTLFRGADDDIKKAIAADYGVADEVIESWLKTLNQVRNICAHHTRLWNRVLGVRPLIPRQRKNPKWHWPVQITNDRLFGVLTILHFLLRQVAPQSAWRQRLLALFVKYPDVPLRFMGFPANWQASPLWQAANAGQKRVAAPGATP